MAKNDPLINRFTSLLTIVGLALLLSPVVLRAADVTERAVPLGKPGASGPTVLVPGVASGQGTQLTAAPNYQLGTGPNNTTTARRIGTGGGAPGIGVATCSCQGQGECQMVAAGPVATCTPMPGAHCIGACMFLPIGANQGGSIMK